MVMVQSQPLLPGADRVPCSGERREIVALPFAKEAPITWVQQFQRQLAGIGQVLPNAQTGKWEGDDVVLQQTQDSTVSAEDGGAPEKEFGGEPSRLDWVNENLAALLQPVQGEAACSLAHHPVRDPLSSKLVALIEQHVAQWLVSAEAKQVGESGQVILQLGEHLLAGATLTLVRQAGGWTLKAQADARTLSVIKRAERQLVVHFADAGLGTLTLAGISPRDERAGDE